MPLRLLRRQQCGDATYDKSMPEACKTFWMCSSRTSCKCTWSKYNNALRRGSNLGWIKYLRRHFGVTPFHSEGKPTSMDPVGFRASENRWRPAFATRNLQS